MKKGKSKSKSRNKVKHGFVKKKSFLDNQRKHKQNVKRVMKDPSLKEDETRVRFETFSSQVSGIKSSIVYQLAGRGNIKVKFCRQLQVVFGFEGQNYTLVLAFKVIKNVIINVIG